MPKRYHRNFNGLGGSSCRNVVDWEELFTVRGTVQVGKWADALFNAAFRCLCLTPSCLCREYGNMGHLDGQENFTG